MSLANRKRNHRVQVRLDDEEYAFFEYNLERTGLSKEVYIRNLLLNKKKKTKEENESNRNILSQLYAIGNNLNQVARLAHSIKVINVERYDKAVAEFKKIMEKFLNSN